MFSYFYQKWIDYKMKNLQKLLLFFELQKHFFSKHLSLLNIFYILAQIILYV